MTAANKVGVWYGDMKREDSKATEHFKVESQGAATVVGAEKAAAAVRAEKAATSAVVWTDKVSAGEGGWWPRWEGQVVDAAGRASSFLRA
uniref:Uncharacterized protein n=1 Tax=Oryza nivara TaxID=4536 RepID=A0A0E0HCN3_ORYNI